MFRSFFYLSLLLFISCSKETTVVKDCESNPKPDCTCITLYDPVCGCNNRIYGNSCAAECDGVSVIYQGACGVGKLLGEWNMMGYVKKNKVDVSNVSRKIPYDKVTILFNNNLNTDSTLRFSGKSSINFIGGSYTASSTDKLKITNTVMTKIAGSLEDLKFEDEYVDNLNNVASYTIKENVLIIKITKEGVDIDEMVFLKKE